MVRFDGSLESSLLSEDSGLGELRRKTYRPPCLEVYGSLVELTRVGNDAVPDGLGGSNQVGEPFPPSPG